ncbi:hypothetical protein JCM10212_001924 [Sporobolomyces blumeae]
MLEVGTQEATRIINHMNNDHEESLGHYLEYFARLPQSVAYAKPRIVDFSSPSMSLEYGPASNRQKWTYKFQPEMEAGQARHRLESMHREAKEGLGISDVDLNRFFLAPSAWISLVVIVALFAWLTSTPAPSIAHTLRWQAPMFRPVLSALSIRPTPSTVGTSIKAFWLASLGIAHFVEIFVCLQPVLRRYNVKSPVVRALYSIATLIAGFPVWTGLRDEGRRQEAKAKKQ